VLVWGVVERAAGECVGLVALSAVRALRRRVMMSYGIWNIDTDSKGGVSGVG
jgi:hypothetical protein